MNTIQIHTQTNTMPVNIRLYKRVQKIWDSLEVLEIPVYQKLKDNHNNIIKFHRDYPSSINACNTIPNPLY